MAKKKQLKNLTFRSLAGAKLTSKKVLKKSKRATIELPRARSVLEKSNVL